MEPLLTKHSGLLSFYTHHFYPPYISLTSLSISHALTLFLDTSYLCPIRLSHFSFNLPCSVCVCVNSHFLLVLYLATNFFVLLAISCSLSVPLSHLSLWKSLSLSYPLCPFFVYGYQFLCVTLSHAPSLYLSLSLSPFSREVSLSPFHGFDLLGWVFIFLHLPLNSFSMVK